MAKDKNIRKETKKPKTKTKKSKSAKPIKS
jgi:hypothetical protein